MLRNNAGLMNIPTREGRKSSKMTCLYFVFFDISKNLREEQLKNMLYDQFNLFEVIPATTAVRTSFVLMKEISLLTTLKLQDPVIEQRYKKNYGDTIQTFRSVIESQTRSCFKFKQRSFKSLGFVAIERKLLNTVTSSSYLFGAKYMICTSDR